MQTDLRTFLSILNPRKPIKNLDNHQYTIPDRVFNWITDFFERVNFYDTLLMAPYQKGLENQFAKTLGGPFYDVIYELPTGRIPDTYGYILAFPPLGKRHDILSIYRLKEGLIEGGVLISLTTSSWRTSLDPVETKFRDWITGIKAEVYDIPERELKDTGISVPVSLVVIAQEKLIDMVVVK